MYLLMGNINPDTIHIIGRWHSDKMLRYLHVVVNTLMHGYATTMVATGDYGLIPVVTSFF